MLGVSVDTVRRWVDSGRIAATRDGHGHRVIAGPDLAAFASQSAAGEPNDGSSARNRLRGIVTAVVKDTVMAQVDIQAGPFRVVSLMSREAVEALGLEVGSRAVAVVKSTNVVVERPARSGGAATNDSVRPARSGGAATNDSVRPARSDGAATNDSVRPARSGGAATNDSVRPARSDGAATNDSVRPS